VLAMVFLQANGALESGEKLAFAQECWDSFGV